MKSAGRVFMDRIFILFPRHRSNKDTFCHIFADYTLLHGLEVFFNSRPQMLVQNEPINAVPGWCQQYLVPLVSGQTWALVGSKL